MTKTQRNLTIALWSLLVITMLVIVASGRLTRPTESRPAAGPSDLPVLFPAAQFALIDHDAKPFSSADLAGRVWVADFIFTNCKAACPAMTERMRDVMAKLPGADVRFVSFTLDPARDTPEALRAYKAKYAPNEPRWTFVTGDKAAIYRALADMKLSAQQDGDTDQILHSQRFLLVDAAGRVRGAYSTEQTGELERLVVETKWLLDTPDGRAPAPATRPAVTGGTPQ